MAVGDLRLVYTVAEAAELLGIGRSTAYELVARGELVTVRLGRRVAVTRPTLSALLGFEPPLPGELDAARRALAETASPSPAPTAARRTTRRGGPANRDGQASLFSA
ncbi:MAG: helix-turn-helix domain-containing protein [Sulfitobacter sp.]|nr:helix-turn-helix domain-containing protein [Sulfitobacter sp.]MCP4106522.1 helix-turn-helix domain-containing protein [Desulfobacteraceae bacterium]